MCDRGNALLKWFSPKGELLRTVAVPGSQPSNIAPMANGHIAIASLNAMILILDEQDKVVSVVGGEAPVYQDGVLKPLVKAATRRSSTRTTCTSTRPARSTWRSGTRTAPIR